MCRFKRKASFRELVLRSDILLMLFAMFVVTGGTMLLHLSWERPRRAVMAMAATTDAGTPAAWPGYPTQDYRRAGDYWLADNGMTRTPRWVMEVLTDRSLAQTVTRDAEHFRADASTPDEFRVTPADYAGSGYDIGHMAPADDHRSSQAAMDATFLFTNAAPQLPNFNRGIWQQLEADVRREALSAGVQETWVITMPLWLPDARGRVTCGVVGLRQVHVPTHFAKSMLCLHKDKLLRMRSWLMPHRDNLAGPPDKYAVSTDTLEAAAGLDLWGSLDAAVSAALERAAP